jgi:hypothetical protein
MLNGLPTSTGEVSQFSCDQLQHQYMLLNSTQKRAWIRAAAKGGVLRLSQPPDDINAMQINVYNPASGLCDGQSCNWRDTDQFDI